MSSSTNGEDRARSADCEPACEFEVHPDEAGHRLDVVLVGRVADMSRARARRLTAEGKVRVNGDRARKGRTLETGDRVVLAELPSSPQFAAAPDPGFALTIAYEDAHVVVVDKPAGVPTHPLRPGEQGTAAGMLLSRYPEMAEVGYAAREPGVVHRLDTDTSGLLVAARTAESFDVLRSSLRVGAFDKWYIALCAGRIEAPCRLAWPLAAAPGAPRRVVACTDPAEAARLRAQPAETEVVSVDRAGPMTWVRVRANRARRHQVRAHLAALGHPLAGDRLYGGPAVAGLGRHFLHASEVRFRHPVRAEPIHVRIALPEDLRRVLDALSAGG